MHEVKVHKQTIGRSHSDFTAYSNAPMSYLTYFQESCSIIPMCKKQSVQALWLHVSKECALKIERDFVSGSCWSIAQTLSGANASMMHLTKHPRWTKTRTDEHKYICYRRHGHWTWKWLHPLKTKKATTLVLCCALPSRSVECRALSLVLTLKATSTNLALHLQYWTHNGQLT